MKSLLILEREDIQLGLSNLPLKDIDRYVFSFISYKAMITHDIVLFMDSDGSMKIISSRYPIKNEKKIF